MGDEVLLAITSEVILFHLMNNQAIMNKNYAI
jgi:hypothetical protein